LGERLIIGGPFASPQPLSQRALIFPWHCPNVIFGHHLNLITMDEIGAVDQAQPRAIRVWKPK